MKADMSQRMMFIIILLLVLFLVAILYYIGATELVKRILGV